MLSVEEAYNHCETIIAHHSKTFYKAFSMLEEDDFKAVWAIYAFCRRADDIVDEGESPEAELTMFKQEFELFLRGEYNPENPIWTALNDVFSRYPMDEMAFRDLLKGQEMDLSINRYESLHDLLEYCYRVASTVGLMLLPILAPKKINVLREGAIALGLGMQLTNILRDIGEDLERNRIYLPGDIMKRNGLTEGMLLTGDSTSDAFRNTWEQLADYAEEFYQKTFQTIDEYPNHSRFAVKGAALLYREILPTIRAKQYKVFHEKHFVKEEAKMTILTSI